MAEALSSFLTQRMEDVAAGNLPLDSLGKWIAVREASLTLVQKVPPTKGWRLTLAKVGTFFSRVFGVDSHASELSQDLARTESRFVSQKIENNIKTFQSPSSAENSKQKENLDPQLSLINQISIGLSKLHRDLSTDAAKAWQRDVNTGKITNASQIPELVELKAMNTHLSVLNSDALASEKEVSLRALQTMIADRYQPNSFWSRLFGDKELKQAHAACAEFIATKPFQVTPPVSGSSITETVVGASLPRTIELVGKSVETGTESADSEDRGSDTGVSVDSSSGSEGRDDDPRIRALGAVSSYMDRKSQNDSAYEPDADELMRSAEDAIASYEEKAFDADEAVGAQSSDQRIPEVQEQDLRAAGAIRDDFDKMQGGRIINDSSSGKTGTVFYDQALQGDCPKTIISPMSFETAV